MIALLYFYFSKFFCNKQEICYNLFNCWKNLGENIKNETIPEEIVSRCGRLFKLPKIRR